MVIKGSVRDSKGDAVPNVTVTVLGTKNVTMTNESGFFTIKAKKNDKLHFTSVGFDAKDVIVNKTAQIDIVMDNEVSKAMNEVVVVGYGTMKKKDLTGAISSIRPDKIAEENPKTVQAVVNGYFDALERRFCAKDFRGCPFVNAVAELGAEDRSIKKIAVAFKEARRQWFRDLLAQLGVADAEALSTQLQLLVDGSIALDLVCDDPAMARAATSIGTCCTTSGICHARSAPSCAHTIAAASAS